MPLPYSPWTQGRGSVLILITALSLSGCAAKIEQHTNAPRLEQKTKMSLHQKAEYFEQGLKAHISEEGLVWYKLGKKNGGFVVTHASLADAAYITGCLAGAEALRYKVTGSTDAKEKLHKLINGLHILQQVTGIKGYIARAFCKKQQSRPEGWLQAKGKYDEYVWRGNTSKDQYTAVMFGYALAYDAVKDDPAMQEIKSIIVKDVSNIADFLIENKFQIIGEKGRTKDGDLSARFLGLVPVGLNALHCLTWIKIAEQITTEERFGKAYEQLLRKGYHKVVVGGFYDRPWPFRDVDYVNNNMAFLDFYSILRLENNVSKYYEKALRKRWQALRNVKCPFWNFVYAAFSKNKEDKTLAVEQAVETLRQFPLMPKRSFDWRPEERKDAKRAGTAFLVAYWIARNHNLISEEQ